MANLKDIRRRIVSVKNTQQITKAMKLVAAAKLRRAQEAMENARPYSAKMIEFVGRLAANSNPESHPLLIKRDSQKVLIVTLTGDKGLCGPFNNSVVKLTNQVIDSNKTSEISLIPVGRRGYDYFKRRPVKILDHIIEYSKQVGYPLAEKIAQIIIDEFSSERADATYIVFNKFKNVATQKAIALPLLPIIMETDTGISAINQVDYEYEPSAEEILDGILTRYVVSQIYQALLESVASEHGARMTAMDGATKNASEMISDLTLEYNRARQAAITTELIEVVTGADALAG
ncbi:MAG TPA: ATP synthase F1 subunit gamma [Nitrospinota bacterium]|jgi:F-type H+-transporting ATPase subunit gamma|nr:ATP synthase F1 subunit gamma [Nitrospinota bacterium]|tara:strand:+ start:79920 stop:80786 length:867 start_codon:yes stop_codon:yes gene_type:complete